MSIFVAPVYKMNSLNNLFIELTASNCNQRCKICYQNLPSSTKLVKDFLSIDRIKEALDDTYKEEVKCIYLTGAEPMLHPDFNTILRLCLKRSNVCICTNASFLNEKKIRFLKKVEEEKVSKVHNFINETNIENQIFFNLSLAHFNEIENDNIKYRGNFRQILFALKTLSRYNFSSVLTILNYYNLNKDLIIDMFHKIFTEHEILNTDLQIIQPHPCSDYDNFKSATTTDCMSSRILTAKGIYSCPFLANDYRGRVGSSFKNYSKTISAESEYCLTCSKNNNKIFTIL